MIAVFKILFYRLFELKIGKFKLEFDDCEAIKFSEPDVEEEEMKEKYEQILGSEKNFGPQTIYYRYFENIGRKRLMELELEDLEVSLNFNQSEKFYSVFYCKKTDIFFWSRDKPDKYLVAFARKSEFTIKFPLKFNPTLAYINSSIKFVLEEVEFNLNDETIELFLAFFWNIKLMNNIKSFAKKQKLDIYPQKSNSPKKISIYEKIKNEYPGVDADYVRPDLVPAVS